MRTVNFFTKIPLVLLCSCGGDQGSMAMDGVDIALENYSTLEVGKISALLLVDNSSGADVCIDSARNPFPLDLFRTEDLPEARSIGVNIETNRFSELNATDKIVVKDGTIGKIPATGGIDEGTYFYSSDGTPTGKAKPLETVYVGIRVALYPCKVINAERAYASGLLRVMVLRSDDEFTIRK